MNSRLIRRKPAPEQLPESLHPITRRVLAGRGITNAKMLDTSLKGLHHVSQLTGIDVATEVLVKALGNDQRILIVGDFDADGATSCALAVRGLRALGAPHVDYLVPNRFEFGYGLTPEIVEVAKGRRPDLIITVDNGISSIAGVAAAQAAGIKVLITDHHLPGAELPGADAIVNPNLPGDDFPSKALAGVGVMFYVLSALRAALRAGHWFDQNKITEPNLAEFLDLVALGTVADVVPLDANNRRLVAQGIKRIRAGHCAPGIKALIRVAGRDRGRLQTSDLGFALGPRLNAAGRLDDISIGVECLLADEESTALDLASKLDRLNRERREIESDMADDAYAAVENALVAAAGELPAALVLSDSSWHQGVVGIVASRLKERFHRPAIVFAHIDQANLKGSARSIEGLHIRDALDRVATDNPGLIERFGGHAMAAGLSLARQNLASFREAFEKVVASEQTLNFDKQWITDGSLGAHEFSLELASELAHIAPWGQSFPAPVFDGVFRIDERRIVGGNHLKLRLVLPQGGAPLEAIAFRAAGEGWASNAKTIETVYRLEVNDYGGRQSVQLVIEKAWPGEVH